MVTAHPLSKPLNIVTEENYVRIVNFTIGEGISQIPFIDVLSKNLLVPTVYFFPSKHQNNAAFYQV